VAIKAKTKLEVRVPVATHRLMSATTGRRPSMLMRNRRRVIAIKVAAVPVATDA
jgi:hypothetical protein